MACKGDQQQFVKHAMLFYALIKIAFQSITHQLFIKNKIRLRNVTTLMFSSDISQIINAKQQLFQSSKDPSGALIFIQKETTYKQS